MINVPQTQLLCFCRAILSPAKIIILDEATSSLDSELGNQEFQSRANVVDNLIGKLLNTALYDRTVLSIVHHLHTIQMYDKVLVMSKGKVIEWGPTEELLKKKNGILRTMVIYPKAVFLIHLR